MDTSYIHNAEANKQRDQTDTNKLKFNSPLKTIETNFSKDKNIQYNPCFVNVFISSKSNGLTESEFRRGRAHTGGLNDRAGSRILPANFDKTLKYFMVRNRAKVAMSVIPGLIKIRLYLTRKYEVV